MRHSVQMQRIFTITAALYNFLSGKIEESELKQFPRNIERIILYGLEIPVIKKPNLTLHAAFQYLCILRNGGLKGREIFPDRDIYGLLHAGPPCNIIFIRENLPEHIRNYILAHELGHFLADIFFIQQLWLKTLPEQRDTIERAFSWQDYDEHLELYALIKGLPNRPKAIVGRGSALLPETAEREIQADLIARELIAPWDTVAALFRPNRRRELITILRDQFGLPLKIATYYYGDLERSLAPKPDMIQRLFSPFLHTTPSNSSKK